MDWIGRLRSNSRSGRRATDRRATDRRATVPRAVEAPLLAGIWPWLLVALLVTIAPQVVRLPLWLTAVWVIAAGWRWLAVSRSWSLPNRWLLLPVTLALIGGLLLHYGTILGRDAGVALLAAMTAMKLLEARTVRDAQVLVFLGYFLLMANLLFSQEIPMIPHLVVAVVLLINVQLLSQHNRSGLDGRRALRMSAVMLAQALPVMLILFLLFPRIPGPLWGLPKDAHSGLTGLSNEMSPGSINELIQSDRVSFRVRFDDQPPTAALRYWRGPVLWWFNGRSWRGIDETRREQPRFQPLGGRHDYTVTLEPHGERWLLALDLPGSRPPDSGFTSSNLLLHRDRVNSRMQYSLSSYTRYLSDPLNDLEQRRGLQLPGDLNPRARELASRWRTEHADPAAIVREGLHYFREQPFYYTLQPTLLGTENNIDEFLFESRRGFCEHYAGSFAFLMRAAGIPARVVLGYQGGELNDDYLIVRQSDAHAWVEVWLDQQGGWTRIDPTAAVAPQRIEQGLFASIDEPGGLPFMARRDGSLLRDLALIWDSVNNAWNMGVLAYGPERQREFLSGLGFGEIDWREMTIAMIVLLGLVPLIAVALLILRRRRTLDPASRLYLRLCGRLARSGLPRRPHEGPLDYTRRVAAERPDLAARLELAGRLYARLRYSEPQNRELQELRRLVQFLRP